MAAMIERLKQGERCWPAEFVLRALGLAGLACCAWLARIVAGIANQPLHAGSPFEFAAAAAACVCLSLGLALTLEGAGLLRPVPVPPRAWLP